MKLSEIEKPLFVVSKNIVEKNIIHMREKAKQHRLIFRPHFKTHQSTPVGSLFKNHGIDKIAVSSMDMAYQFHQSGFTDICLAILFNPKQAHHLAYFSHHTNFCIVLESGNYTKHLDKHCAGKVDVMIKIDTGANRTGLSSTDYHHIHAVIKSIASTKYLHFKGFLVHNGQTYYAGNINEIKTIHKKSLQQLRQLKAEYSTHSPVVSLGDTPSASICNDFQGIDELRPGNFVYYDYMQYRLGSCQFKDIACLLSAPVLSVQSEQNKIVIHGGAIHLSKEKSISDTGQEHYGEIVLVDEKFNIQRLQPRAYVTALSQEHGIIRNENSKLHNLRYGDVIGVIPVHSCLTANLMSSDTVYID